MQNYFGGFNYSLYLCNTKKETNRLSNKLKTKSYAELEL